MNYFEVLVWPGGGAIGIILWLMSIATVAIIVQYFFAISRDSIVPDIFRQNAAQLIEAGKYQDVIDLAAREVSFLGQIVKAGLAEAKKGYPAMERAMEQAADQSTTKLLRHIEWLNLVGNISPMLGLLGTVWGMINAFFNIVAAGGGTPSPGQLAGSIGIALVTTLLGLAIAIPALAVYSIMKSRIDALTTEAMVVGQRFLAGFVPPKTKP